MADFKTFVLHSSDYKAAFDRLFDSVSWKSHHLEFIANAETIRMTFTHTLITEETGLGACSSEKASHLGEKILMMLDQLYFLISDNAEIHKLLTLLAVSTGTWIANHKGTIKELELIVSGIASFANHASGQQELEELYEISMLILYATDEYIKADHDKRNTQRPWRYLCLNHCIIATRTGNVDLARLSYDRLIEYLPEEAESFFKMGVQKANAGKYSLHCQKMIQAYYEMYRSDVQPNAEMRMSFN